MSGSRIEFVDGFEQTCVHCGDTFQTPDRKNTLCSDECRRERFLAQKRRYERKKSGRDITPETGQAQLISKEWPRGYGIFHWGEIREWAAYGTCPPDAVFVDLDDDTIRFRIQVTQESFDEGACAPQNLVRVV